MQTIQPRKEQQKRLRAVRAFWARAETAGELRGAVLSLRVCLYCQNTVSKVHGETPALVSLATGKIQERAGQLVADLLGRLGEGPKLPAVAACISLLTPYGHMLIRLQQFANYPCKVWAMPAEFNPRGWPQACCDFLAVPAVDLDLGYSYWLQKEAKDKGTEAESISSLMSKSVQSELAQAVQTISVTVLSAERKHAADKKNEFLV